MVLKLFFSHHRCDIAQKAEVVPGCRVGRITHEMYKVIAVRCSMHGAALPEGYGLTSGRGEWCEYTEV